MSTLIHSIYASVANHDFTESELGQLLSRSRINNAARDITGMLVYVDGSFFQVLEGPAESVAAVYAKILVDTRHARITQIIREPIAKRAFGDWTMGYSRVSRQDLSCVEGLNDFFASNSCLEQMGEGRARKLLRSFEQGRWRFTPRRAPDRTAAAASGP